MSHEKIAVNRTLVGVLALACLIAAGVIMFQGATAGNALMWQGAFVRVGIVMAAFWLALPTKNREAAYANVSPTTFVGLILGIFAVARYPRTVLPVLIVIAVIGYFLRPRRRGPRT